MRLKKDNVERITDSEKMIAKLKAKGFEEAETSSRDMPRGGEADTGVRELCEMNVQELKALAKEKGLEGYSGLTKEQLLTILKDVV